MAPRFPPSALPPSLTAIDPPPPRLRARPPPPHTPPPAPPPCVQRGEADVQFIAHDREVYDFSWGGVGVFATASADGSIRVFDLR